MGNLQSGIAAFKSGKRKDARKYLIAAMKENPKDENAWGWLYQVANNDNERIECLKKVTAINPNNEKAKQLLDKLLAPPLTPIPEITKPPQQKQIPPASVAPRKNNRKTLIYSITILVALCLVCLVATIAINAATPSQLTTPNATQTETPSPTNTVSPLPSETPSRIPSKTSAPTETALPSKTPTLVSGAMVIIKSVNKDVEYVDLENIGNQLQDLTGWKIVSEKGNQTCWLAGIIQPSEILRVWTDNPNGEGHNCAIGNNIWNNNESDPAALYNAQGIQISYYP